MQNHKLIIYLDGLRAGHAYLELLKPGETAGDVYGFYPAKYDEKREVLFGEGMVRKDRSRLDDNRSNDEVTLIGKSVEFNRSAYERTFGFLEDKIKDPHYYFLVGYNCIDFIQEVYAAALGKKSEDFLTLFSKEELDKLSWVGVYANLLKTE